MKTITQKDIARIRADKGIVRRGTEEKKRLNNATQELVSQIKIGNLTTQKAMVELAKNNLALLSEISNSLEKKIDIAVATRKTKKSFLFTVNRGRNGLIESVEVTEK